MVMDIEPLAGASNYTHLEARHDLGMHTVNDPSPQIPYGLIARLVAGVEVASPPWGRLRFRNQYLSTTNIIGCHRGPSRDFTELLAESQDRVYCGLNQSLSKYLELPDRLTLRTESRTRT
ncbi:hypothetical protein CIHG_00972 [Coccidioides immitis H538.4]|uniref:Uncharacterized protein n=3 Tax=Coccidioides immitis TaxID=5501 RepID=A0A0J8TLX4_COCIT|nr:hypothetical protein CIRG_03387 [Coccidioides immitis RMSCC 2394]KMU74667.1 hypothetical protein CISG_00597 [Coccidioides immitis RMSCC 3703]KMU83190.1 hypothetical protein CIHG_00972 [Coccidioides immitis H538.4]